MTRKDTQIIAAEMRTEWQAYEDIARMLEADGVTADDVLGLEAAIRYNKAAMWARARDEWTDAYDNSMETLSLNAFAAAHIAEIMNEHDPYGYNTESKWDALLLAQDAISDEEHETLRQAITQNGTPHSGDVLYCDGNMTDWVFVDPSTYWTDQLVDFDALVPATRGGYYAHKKGNALTTAGQDLDPIMDERYANDPDYQIMPDTNDDDDNHTALAAEPDLDAIKDACPDFAYCGTDAPEVMAIQEKLRADDDHTDVDDSWMDRRCYTTIRAKDGGSGQRVDVDPPTWRDKLELEHQLREDGYEFVDVTTDGGRLVIVWYRPQMPRPMVDRIIKEIEEA